MTAQQLAHLRDLLDDAASWFADQGFGEAAKVMEDAWIYAGIQAERLMQEEAASVAA